MAICAIALGSNLGDSKSILESALEKLDRTSGITLRVKSSLYQTKAVTLDDRPQPDYLNACALLETSLNPEKFLAVLQQVEHHFGRVRQERWGARTLDLDLLLFNDVILHTHDLELPHPRMTERAFVLVPLSEIAPDWIHPVLEQSIAQLVQNVERSGVKKLQF
jgi:2-amino-4-hydroxy-6-hydroxymethyldihydropteridine diphosphokinase